MRILLLSVFLMLTVSAFADEVSNEFSTSAYRTLAVAPPRIAQIYINPALSSMEDVELSPENQIELFESFGDNLCRKLAERSNNRLTVLCTEEIKSHLGNDLNWDDFVSCFSGRRSVNSEVSRLYAERIKADGIISISLLFNYYVQSDDVLSLEVFIEWDVINLATGSSVAYNDYSCINSEISEKDDNFINNEFSCFEQSSGKFIDFFADLYGLDKKS